jgi:hypothetical protein
MRKFIGIVRKYRIVGYIIVGLGMHKAGMSIDIIAGEMFLTILLVELASRKGKKIDLSQKDGQDQAKEMVKEYMDEIK